MARKNYSEEFRRQAVDLYESTPGATVRGIADDLGVERGTLRHWLELYGTGKKTAGDGTLTRSPLNPSRSDPAGQAAGRRAGVGDAERTPESPEQELARLRARVVELEASEKKLTTEREILRSAAKYFAGETNW
jgi:transposase